MLKIKTSLQSKDTAQNLGQIIVELTEVDYNRIVEYVLPIVFEEVYKSMNYKSSKPVDPLIRSLMELFYEEKKLSIEAVKAAVTVFPTSMKEKLIRIVLRDVSMQEKVRQVLNPYGMSLGKIEILEDTGESV